MQNQIRNPDFGFGQIHFSQHEGLRESLPQLRTIRPKRVIDRLFCPSPHFAQKQGIHSTTICEMSIGFDNNDNIFIGCVSQCLYVFKRLINGVHA